MYGVRNLMRCAQIVPKLPVGIALCSSRSLSSSSCHMDHDVHVSHAQYSRFDPVQWIPRWEKRNMMPVAAGKTFVPKTSITIKYGDKQVLGGNELHPSDVKTTPNVFFAAEKDSYYTLVLTDADSSLSSEWLGWAVTNIHENHVLNGEELAPYLGVCPSKGTGTHRLAFILYKQSRGRMDFNCEPKFDSVTVESRGVHWKAAEFAHKHDLIPVGMNFFEAKWDSYVEDLKAMSRANKPKTEAERQQEFEDMWESAYRPRCMETLR